MINFLINKFQHPPINPLTIILLSFKLQKLHIREYTFTITIDAITRTVVFYSNTVRKS